VQGYAILRAPRPRTMRWPLGGVEDTMDKRLMKRHQRQVARAKERVKLSEPDLRTPEQVSAARETSRSVAGQHDVPRAPYAAASVPNQASPAADSTPKADTEPSAGENR